MRTLKYLFPALTLFLAISCSGDKAAMLEKMKKQQSALDAKIKKLESEQVKTDSLDPSKFRLVGITEVQPDAFKDRKSVV